MSKETFIHTQKYIEYIIYLYLTDVTNVVIITFFSNRISFGKKSVVFSTKFAHGWISSSTDHLFFNGWKFSLRVCVNFISHKIYVAIKRNWFQIKIKFKHPYTTKEKKKRNEKKKIKIFYHSLDGAYIRYIKFVGIYLVSLLAISSAAALDTVHTNIFFVG